MIFLEEKTLRILHVHPRFSERLAVLAAQIRHFSITRAVAPRLLRFLDLFGRGAL